MITSSSASPTASAPEVFAVDFATLAREIAQDIFSVEQIVELHRLTNEEWAQIQAHPRFVAMLNQMQRDWQSASNTRERVKIKAQTGLESVIEVFIADINNPAIPLSQRTEAGKFLARLGEMDGAGQAAPSGDRVVINIIAAGDAPLRLSGKVPVTIDHEPAIPEP